MNLSFNLFNWWPLVLVLKHQRNQQQKTHDYSQFIKGRDYVFEPLNQGLAGQMTGVGRGIKPRDYIILRRGSELSHYQVEEIDYYADPPDMWMALLKKVIDNS
ncbi:hypothetical protein IQ259_10455 [Fortiea sp. LEGE XX443]|uniref:hypothetical protein n=1 Tax=Fortiea sp. LEGE XX443 TaxID=1828611 RepID=UPI001880A6A3|nr:hypothetical protein [Fortiea sp. LEGE XX443]MBE9005455.1 hypothetical protein [Fortiea sp. LEGE XX443]